MKRTLSFLILFFSNAIAVSILMFISFHVIRFLTFAADINWFLRIVCCCLGLTYTAAAAGISWLVQLVIIDFAESLNSTSKGKRYYLISTPIVIVTFIVTSVYYFDTPLAICGVVTTTYYIMLMLQGSMLIESKKIEEQLSQGYITIEQQMNREYYEELAFQMHQHYLENEKQTNDKAR